MTTPQVLPGAPDGDGRARQLLITWAALAGLLAAIVFVGFPSLDLGISRLAFRPQDGFLLAGPGPGEVARQAFNGFFAGLCAIAALGVLMAAARRPLLGRGLRTWLFLGLVLAIGPGILANLVFKDHWGRARPHQVTDFGGGKAFSPALARSTACPKNCSFIGGEASSAYASGFALALLYRRRRRALMAGAVAFGTAAGLIRIGQGAHFASDVVFAGVFMALVAASLHWLVFEHSPRPRQPGRREPGDPAQNTPAQSAASTMRS